MSDAGEWYATDALGSVRLTLDNNGTAYSGATYDPWGSPERGSVGTFGFTGELQQGDQVYLRARWYNANNGTFTSKDPFEGYPQQPYSLHPYQYAYSNPVLWTDPSGRCIPGFDTDCQFDLNIPSLENLCVSSWVPLIGQEDCKPIGNVDDFRETIIDPLVGAVKPTYDFVTNQPGAHETVGNGLEYIVQHPINSGIEVTKGLITPFVNIYQGLTCSDSKQLAHGLIGFGFLLGSARLIRNTPSVPEASAPQLILVTNPKANLPLGHNMVGVQIPGAVKPTIYHQQVGGLSASNGAIRNFISTIRGGQQTTIVTNSGKNLGNFKIGKIALSEEQAQTAYITAQKMTGRGEPYHILNNSCTTTCINVLNAAGLKPPWWARTPHLLDLWFRFKGKKNLSLPVIYEGER
jgi:RHS repeat-associated protein